MATVDFGPVPVSRFKGEVQNMLTALGHQRRVLISRHGSVVASIEPPTVQHARLLLDFTTRTSHEREVPVLTMSDIGRGSPSASIRNAENGIESLLTHGGKVRGVLTRKPEPRPVAVVNDRASALSVFAREHPDATPQEFADFSDSLDTDASAPAVEDSITEDDVMDKDLTVQWVNVLAQVGKLEVPFPVLADTTAPSDEVIYVDFAHYKDQVIKLFERADDEVGLLTNAAQIIPDILHLGRPAVTFTSPARALDLRLALGSAEQAVLSAEQVFLRAEHTVQHGRDPVDGLDFEDSTHE